MPRKKAEVTFKGPLSRSMLLPKRIAQIFDSRIPALLLESGHVFEYMEFARSRREFIDKRRKELMPLLLKHYEIGQKDPQAALAELAVRLAVDFVPGFRVAERPGRPTEWDADALELLVERIERQLKNRRPTGQAVLRACAELTGRGKPYPRKRPDELRDQYRAIKREMAKLVKILDDESAEEDRSTKGTRK